MDAAARHKPSARGPGLVLVRPAAPMSAAGARRPASRGPILPGPGDDAIGELWRTHGAAIMRFALSLTPGDRQRAEDIVQEALVRAWRHPEVVACGSAAIRSWLFTVIRHVAIDMWRSSPCAEESVSQHDDWPDPTEHIDRAVIALDVRAALARLTPEHRKVIVAMYYHARPVAEIADALGIPAGTVKSRAHYGLRQLRRELCGATAHRMARELPRAASA